MTHAAQHPSDVIYGYCWLLPDTQSDKLQQEVQRLNLLYAFELIKCFASQSWITVSENLDCSEDTPTLSL